MSGTESRLQRRIVEMVRERGGWAVVTTCPPLPAGTPDILACVDGRAVAIEVKSPRGRLSPRQSLALDEITAAGGVAVVVRSIEDATRVLDNVKGSA